MSEKADWKGVGDSLKALGDRISVHAAGGSASVKDATAQAGPGAVDQAKAGGKAVVDSFDAATRDPEVGAALKDATNKLLDAVKVSLTGGDSPPAEKSDEPHSPPSVEPPTQ